MMKRIKFILAFSGLLLIAGCSEDEKPKPYLVSAEPYLFVSSSTLRTFLQASGIKSISADEIKYDVDVFKVTYRTTFKGEIIEASGLIALPQTSTSVPMISFQHGTISDHEDAPSTTPTSDQSIFLYAALASPGFIAVVPDYIGFGASEELNHPYYVEEVTTSSVVDNLKAAKELSTQHDVVFNGKLFLAGYSQGGYATMATHKFIEEKKLNEFDLVASFPASGGYDIKGMQEYFFSLDSYHQPFYISYVAYSYFEYYDWATPLSDFFDEPYASRIPELFNGTKGGSEINNQLTESISGLINDDLLTNIDTDPKYAYVVDAFNENSLLDWTPTIPMYMYHGDQDDTVPYQNSIDTYEQLISNGASESVVHFIPLPGADHTSGLIPYIEDFIPKLISLQ